MYKKLLALSLASLAFVQTASADTILKFGLSEVGPDTIYEDGFLFTRDDGNLSTSGDQNTALNFTGFLEPLFADIMSGASFTLDGISAVGDASESSGLVTQQTTGGTFSVWNEADELLLAAELGEGVISGSTTQSTGSFFNTEVANYTGGSLLSYIAATPGGISISLASIFTGMDVGLQVNDNNVLQNFTANANGLVTGEPIPEPATAALLFSGLAGCAVRRKRKLAA